jgi:hypothetical protein
MYGCTAFSRPSHLLYSVAPGYVGTDELNIILLLLTREIEMMKSAQSKILYSWVYIMLEHLSIKGKTESPASLMREWVTSRVEQIHNLGYLNQETLGLLHEHLNYDNKIPTKSKIQSAECIRTHMPVHYHDIEVVFKK